MISLISTELAVALGQLDQPPQNAAANCAPTLTQRRFDVARIGAILRTVRRGCRGFAILTGDGRD
jgi:hypothetical protein